MHPDRGLGPLLQGYHPADPLEAEHLRRMRALLGGQEDPFSRGSFTPGHFTASSFVLNPRRDALLLIHHRKLGRWLQPGGHIDPDDPDTLAAARREVLEEVGLPQVRLLRDGLFDLDIHTIPPLKGEPAHEHFDLRFVFEAPSEQVQAGDDVGGARWLALHEVNAEISDESVMRALRKIQRGEGLS